MLHEGTCRVSLMRATTQPCGKRSTTTRCSVARAPVHATQAYTAARIRTHNTHSDTVRMCAVREVRTCSPPDSNGLTVSRYTSFQMRRLPLLSPSWTKRRDPRPSPWWCAMPFAKGNDWSAWLPHSAHPRRLCLQTVSMATAVSSYYSALACSTQTRSVGTWLLHCWYMLKQKWTVLP